MCHSLRDAGHHGGEERRQQALEAAGHSAVRKLIQDDCSIYFLFLFSSGPEHHGGGTAHIPGGHPSIKLSWRCPKRYPEVSLQETSDPIQFTIEINSHQPRINLQW